MEVILAKHSGFCMGVNRAVKAVLNVKDKKVCVLGELVHNKSVNDELENRGVKIAKSFDDIEGDVIVIRSHGETKETIDALKKTGKTILDCTCPFVSKIHDIVSDYSRKGYKILILGDDTHPEVKGTKGWVFGEKPLVQNRFDEKYDYNSHEKLCIVAQTTYNLSLIHI